ncbi:MAG: ornithine cyclodeaminase family protein [Halofilum sp. (in: g-proteobacteria)]|nr:ornithine cyclodeaminase family protein [Halofilum sp. (in: g-proteobacteria)]
MQLIDADTVHRLLDYPGLIDALADAHRGDEPMIDRSLLQADESGPHGGESFLVLPAWRPGRAMGVKIATVMPRNGSRHPGLPTIHALYPLFDGDTGEPLAVIDGTALTLRKTAADSALGARLLARADAGTLLMVGAGALAPHLVAAHRAARPSLRRVLVWNRSAEQRDRLVERLCGDGVEADAVGELEEAAGEADVICCATSSTEPLVRGAWLRPGTHLDLVGAYNPGLRESDDECVRRATLFVDWRGSTVEAAGDLVQPIADGVIGAGDIAADLFALCRGEHGGRRDDDEITLYKNGGGGHLDLFTAEYLVTRLHDRAQGEVSS